MGIFRAISAAVHETAQIQWRELFLCDALPKDVLLTRGRKQISSRSANTNQEDDTITHGSIIAIADGQAAIVVSGGKVVACCTEPGEFVYEDPNHAPALKSFFRETARRISFGGDAPSAKGVQRVYYVNTKESFGNSFSGELPMSYDLAGRGGMTGRLRCGGRFSYRVVDPVRFYKLVTGNVRGSFTREDLSRQLSAHVLQSLGRSAARLSREEGLRPVELAANTERVCAVCRRELEDDWMQAHGLELISLAVDRLEPMEQGILRRTGYAASLVRDPARPASAPLRGMPTGPAPLQSPGQAPKKAPPTGPWTCVCGARAERNFCPDCGRPRPKQES